jgi:acetylornithine/succinyldiaminopimelate/putrescine aminotransferase/predicted amino acid dehydrogenase|tara:strand:- start:3513 stop:6257 length:2745 start_codon:yes stop_codon:yes gene_type:complete
MSDTTLYKEYIRPAVAELMELLKIDKDYHHGEGDYLFTLDKNNEEVKILDLVGGYGANLLGHKNREITDTLISALENNSPSNVQGSVRSSTSKFGRIISDLLIKETGREHYICHLSNSGTEAVEAALKLAALRSFERRTRARQRNQQSLNVLQSIEARKVKKVNQELMKSLGVSEVRDLIEVINKHNKDAFRAPFAYLAIEGSFHGKTLGSLGVTYQDSFKEKFLQSNNCLFIERNNIDDLNGKVNDAKQSYYHFDETTGRINLKHSSYVAGIIAEPIQGEAGVHELSREFLAALRQAANDCNSLLIFDEVQSGLYRTGTLSAATHHKVVADVYAFSKSLGGGVSKIAATLIDSEFYFPQFGILHTSTFAEDEVSSIVAAKVLEVLSQSIDKEFDNNSEYFQYKLSELRKKYPNIICSHRGKGYMRALEISGAYLQSIYEIKLYDDLGLFGHLFSSAVINNENIRISPTLSSPRSLRFEPSIKFGKEESDELFDGLDRAFSALNSLDMTYFFGHLSEGIPLEAATIVKANYLRKNQDCAVFLGHMIHTKDAWKIHHAFKNLSEEALEEFMYAILEYAKFSIYDIQEIQAPSGKKIDAILFSLPVSTKVIYQYMKEGKAELLIGKIQQAIIDAKKMGATTVGLGQFTSIVSNNGLTLDPCGVNLTTGNAYTVGLGVQGALKVCKEKLGTDENLDLGCVGAAGNIVSVATSLLADNAAKITLIYHTPFEDSAKMQKAFNRLVEEIIKSQSDCELVKKVKEIAKDNHDHTSLYKEGKFKNVIDVSVNLDDLKGCDLIFSGTNSQGILLKQEHISENTVIVDAGVPSNVDSKIKLKNVVVIHGGLAKLPSETQFNVPVFPLPRGESFACMAETFALSLNEETNVKHIGHLDKEIVQRAVRIATEAGISLGNIKSMNLF